MCALLIDCSGGLELLFENKKAIDLVIETGKFSMKDLIEELRAKHLKDRDEMFV